MSSTKHSDRIKNKRRLGNSWVSKNRVLNPDKGKRVFPVYRNPNFDTFETKLLIQLWGDPKIQRELITTHKKHLVIAQLASKMEEYGYYRSPDELTTRIKNMKCFYNRLKKEKETNPDLDPSWRHYADMDAIMTRPIFSVRPNEVPAPSLKYLMEQKEESRKERKRKAEEEGIDISDSDDDIEDVLAVPLKSSSDRSEDECIVPDAHIEFECDEVTLAAISKGTTENFDNTNNEAENKNANAATMDDELFIKMEIESEEFQDLDQANKEPSKKNEEKKDDAQLLTPKVEPIDVDDPIATSCSNDNKPPAKSAVVTAPNLLEILNQPKSSQAVVTSMAISNFSVAQSACYTKTTPASASSPMVITSTAPSKISVVSPTILMPQTTQLSTTDALPMRLGGNLQAFLTSTGTGQTVTATNGMKFILLNTGDQRKTTTLGTPTMTLAAPGRSINTSNVNVNQNLQSPQNVSNPLPLRSQRITQNPPINKASNGLSASKKVPGTHSHPDKGDTLKRKELAGIKSSLMRLLKSREDGNELQSQRLAIERERLQHERNVSEKYLAIFEQNQKFQQQLLQQQQMILQLQQQQQLLQAQQRTASGTPQLFATTANGAATGVQMMPPKVLITTMVPTSAANGSGTMSATFGPKVLTTANFKNLTTNVTPTSSDKPLLIPKEEPDN